MTYLVCEKVNCNINSKNNDQNTNLNISFIERTHNEIGLIRTNIKNRKGTVSICYAFTGKPMLWFYRLLFTTSTDIHADPAAGKR